MPTPKLCRNPDGRAYATIPESGRRRKYFGTYGTPEAEAAYRRWLGQILRNEQDAAPIPVVGNDTTIAELVAPFLDHAIGYYARGGTPTPEYRNVRDSMRILLRYAGDDLAASFGPNALRSVRAAMVRDGWTTETGKRRKYSRAYANSTVNRILRLFRWCESRELLPRGSADHLRTLEPLRKGKATGTAEPPPIMAVSWETVATTLPFCRDDLAALIVVQYWSGMRPSEACRLCVRDLDMTGDVWLYHVREHKTDGHGHRLVKAVPLPAQAALRPFVDRATDPAAPLFLTRFGRPYTADVYGKAILRAIEAAERSGVRIPRWTPLQLRHGIAETVDALAGREAAQLYLGHSRPDTTAIYAGRNMATLRRVAAALGTPIPDEPRP